MITKITALAAAFVFTSFSLGFSQDKSEQLTITTYYPSPYGSYNELQLYPHDKAVAPCGPATPETRGTLFYHYDEPAKVDQIEVCNGTDWIRVAQVGKTSDLWVISSGNPNDIHNTNTRNVGIGTNNPQAKLDVAGTVQMTGFKLPTGAQAGYVLTANDASGLGEWKPSPGGGSPIAFCQEACYGKWPKTIGGKIRWQVPAGETITFTDCNTGALKSESRGSDFWVAGSICSK